MAYHGYWSWQPYFEFGREDGYLAAAGGIVLDDESESFLYNTLNSDPTDVVDEAIGITIGVSDGMTLPISAWLYSENLGNGYVNFSSTAVLSLIASDGVTLSFSDSQFLSASPSTAIVPIPASALLLIAAVAGLGVIGQRKRS
jgi:hypothetical protein